MEEDWDGKHQKQLQQNTKDTQIQDIKQKNSFQMPKVQQLQAQDSQHPQTQNYKVQQSFQHAQSQSFNILDPSGRRRWKNSMKSTDLTTQIQN